MPAAHHSVVVHDFFVQDGGAEACAVEFARLLPTATVRTTFFDADRFGARIDPERVRSWPLQRLTGPTPRFRALLPLYPAYFSLLDLGGADLVVSSSVAFAKAVRTRPGSLHIAYVYTPMRYAWDLDRYLAGSSFGRGSRLAARTLRPVLRRWDRATARRPDVLVAISEAVRDRIRRLWRRDSTVIHPPVETSALELSARDDGFLLVAARLLSYRRIDLAIEACRRTGRELVVVGDGPERRRLAELAGQGPIRFLGHVDRAALIDLFMRCHAYLVPGVEDFGIAPVEAMAAGKPVAAFAGGGALETVIDGRNGVLFHEATSDALVAALERLDAVAWDRAAIRASAERFDTAVFRARWRDLFRSLGVDPSLYAGGDGAADSERNVS